MPMNDNTQNADWTDYRRTKHRLIILLIGWAPFGFLIGGFLPIIFNTYTPTYILAVIYMLLVGYYWLKYVFYPCPNCGLTYRGRQLHRGTCPRCGILINR